MAKGKVCHITSAHDPEDIRIFHKECVSLARAGYEVYLVEQGDSYAKDGVQIVGAGYPAGGRLNRMTAFAKKVYQAALAVDADLYQIHDPELLPYALKLKKRGKKVIFDSHELYAVQLQEKPYLPAVVSHIIARCYVPYERSILRQIDGVIFPCPINGKHPFVGMSPRWIYLNNVPLPSEYEGITPAEGASEPFSACYVGPIRPDRGNLQNVQACNQAQVPLHLGGTVSSEAFRGELDAADTCHLVDFRGQLSRPQVYAMLQESSVGLVTELNVGQNNRLDNLPTKTYEYMAAGLPVIISASPYVERLLKEIPFGIAVDPGKAEQTAQALLYLREHPEEARRMGLTGRRAVEERFNWDVEVRSLLELYQELLKV